jgi:phosphoribosylamine--glycine ligase
MNVLVIGSGGREHAIAHKFSKSEKVEKVFVSPGNPGMLKVAELAKVSNNDEIIEFVNKNNIELVFVGPEQPLAEGLVDILISENIKAIGPTKSASRIESSKEFAKNLMHKYGIPTAAFAVFTKLEEALDYCKSQNYPLVLKADGLAAGKGVVICQNFEEASKALVEMMQDKKFGESGNTIVVEEFMVGWEASIFAFCDGEDFVTTVFSQDHKPLLNGNAGPNTGGMGAYAPVEAAEKYREEIETKIIKPTLKAMKSEGCPYTGVLYAGLMITEQGPKVVEFNCRFGDPETEVVLPLMKTDLVDVCEAICEKSIDNIKLEWEEKFAVTVVAASKGYPEKYKKGLEINISEINDSNQIVYYAGVREENGSLLTNGGRVLMATAVGKNKTEAIDAAYQLINQIEFDGIYFRTDIAQL